MKKTLKPILKILPAVLAALAVTVVLLTAFRYYEDSGNVLLLTEEDYAALADKLEALNFPYGTEVVENDGEDLLEIRTRAELMPILEEVCTESGADAVPVYRDAHKALFASVIVSGAVVSLSCAGYGICLKKSAVQRILFAAAFLAIVGCMTWLAELALAV